MKKKFTTLLASFLFLTISYGQLKDSVRTRNDKPGTPQSLRTPNMSPRIKVHVSNKDKGQNQTINHGATESNKVINSNENTIIANPEPVTEKEIPKTPITLEANRKLIDTSKNNGIPGNGQSNVTNPIRKF